MGCSRCTGSSRFSILNSQFSFLKSLPTAEYHTPAWGKNPQPEEQHHRPTMADSKHSPFFPSKIPPHRPRISQSSLRKKSPNRKCITAPTMALPRPESHHQRLGRMLSPPTRLVLAWKFSKIMAPIGGRVTCRFFPIFNLRNRALKSSWRWKS